MNTRQLEPSQFTATASPLCNAVRILEILARFVHFTVELVVVVAAAAVVAVVAVVAKEYFWKTASREVKYIVGSGRFRVFSTNPAHSSLSPSYIVPR